MGNPVESARPPMRLWSRAADLCSRLLEPPERDVVLGDLAESNVRDRDAFVAVSSLVVRRQLALWTDWRPWLAVTGIALPIGLVLSVLARSSADGKAVYAFLYINRFQWLYVENPGSRHHMIALATGFALDCLTLALWSWTAGFVLGRLSRRAAWITAAVFALAVLAATMGTETTARMHNDPVFSLHFYGVVFPRLVRFGVVLLPALSGLRRALAARWPPLPVTLAGALVIVALTAWSTRDVEAALTFGRGLLPLPGPDGIVGTADDVTSWRFVPFVLLWPSAFIVTGSLAMQWRWRRPLLLTLLVGMASVVSLHAQQPSLDYTQWRGAERDGSASGFLEPSTWPDVLTRRWSVTVGEGYATPLVVSGTVYVFTRRAGEEVLTALDGTNGRERWRSGYPAAYTPSQPAAAHGSGPKATPLFLDGRIYTLGISGILSAFDASTGKILWQTREPVEPPYFSAASSPAGEDRQVFAHPGNYEPLTSLDAITGTVKWRTGPGGFFMSPLLATLEGTRQVVSVTQDSVIGVAVGDGRLLWTRPWPGGGNGGSMPVLDHDTIVVASSAGTIAFKPTKHGETWITETIWENRDVSMYLSNPVVVDGVLYGLSTRNSGQFFALDVHDGHRLWVGQPREATNTAVVKAGRTLFLLNDDGELLVAKASRRALETIARYKVAESATWAQPTISGARIYIKDVDTVALWTLR